MVDLKTSIIIFVPFSAIFFLNSCEAALCVEKNSCTCQIDEDTKIDISNLITSHDHYLEDFKDNVTYYFSGCKDAEINVIVMKNNSTSNSSVLIPTIETVTASLLLYDNGTNDYVILGNANHIHFNKDAENNYEIVYINKNLTSTIKLICDGFNIPIFKTIEAKERLNHEFALASPRACVIVEHGGMSGGSKFLLFLLIIISVYSIGGGLILYLIRGARGLEMIPNLDFWRNFPGLVKDGVIFLLSGCRPTLITSAETYDRI